VQHDRIAIVILVRVKCRHEQNPELVGVSTPNARIMNRKARCRKP